MVNYGSVVDADAFFDDRVGSTWPNFTTPDKTKALTQATNQIDHLQFKGFRFIFTQLLEFPRSFAGGTRSVIFDIDQTTGDVIVPRRVIEATYLQAKFILDQALGGDQSGEQIRAGITSISIGGTSESYDKSISPVDIQSGILRDALFLLGQYLLVAY